VIGERRLTTRAGARPKRVTVSLGKPRLPKGQTDWECPFRITGDLAQLRRRHERLQPRKRSSAKSG
jgi:hypothetical protein